MKKVTLATGALIGGLLGILLITLLYLGNQAFGLPFVPFDLWNWQARVVPRNLLSLAVAGVGGTLAKLFGATESVWGQAAERIAALVIPVLLLALFGLVIAWVKRRVRLSGRWIGAAVGALVFILVAMVALSVGLGNPVLPLLGLAVLWVGWGMMTGLVIEGELLAPVTSQIDEERREGLLQMIRVVAGASLASWALGRMVGAGDRESGADQPLAGLTPAGTPEPVAETQGTPPAQAEAVPVGEDGRIVPVPGTREEVTPEGEFYSVDIAASPPTIDGETWRLNISGLFDNASNLTLSDLRAYPAHTQPITLSCISNPVGGSAISTGYWIGLRLQELMADLGLQAEANFLFVKAADGFYETVPMAVIEDPRTLLVYGMNDRSLPRKHGYPLRIYIPNRFGMKQPKWIQSMEAVAEDQGGYWTERGWSKQAIAKTTSVIDVVATDEAHDGLVPVGGVAWAGARGIQRVDVQVDGGEWTEAVLRTPPLGPLTWVQWRYEWRATAGDHRLTVRATDGEGTLQTAEETPVSPDGATGYHSIETTIG
jgi:DMSO/TMAO reductase YedYZ molybdopterin-dependent catalytic subunit